MMPAHPPATVLEPHGLDDAAMQGLFALAVRLYSHQLYTQSARVMQFLLRHEPARPQYQRALGKALHASGQHEEALQAYARAVKLGMPDADVHFYIAQCLVYTHRREAAQQALERCLNLARQQPQKLAGLIERADLLLTRLQQLDRKATAGLRPALGPSSP